MHIRNVLIPVLFDDARNSEIVHSNEVDQDAFCQLDSKR